MFIRYSHGIILRCSNQSANKESHVTLALSLSIISSSEDLSPSPSLSRRHARAHTPTPTHCRRSSFGRKEGGQIKLAKFNCLMNYLILHISFGCLAPNKSVSWGFQDYSSKRPSGSWSLSVLDFYSFCVFVDYLILMSSTFP